MTPALSASCHSCYLFVYIRATMVTKVVLSSLFCPLGKDHRVRCANNSKTTHKYDYTVTYKALNVWYFEGIKCNQFWFILMCISTANVSANKWINKKTIKIQMTTSTTMIASQVAMKNLSKRWIIAMVDRQKQSKAKFSFSLVCDISLCAVNLSKNIKIMQQKKTWCWLMVDNS